MNCPPTAFKQQRLKTIKAAKTALEAREEALHPASPLMRSALPEARIMGKKGDFDYRYKSATIKLSLSQNANDKQEQEGLPQSTGQLP